MSVINSIPLIAAGDDGYQISRSVRLRSSASAYFNRTFGTPTNRKIFTWSAWIKRGVLGSNFMFGRGTGPESYIDFTNDSLEYYDYTGSAYSLRLVTSQVFRDPSAWYHIVVAVDTTQATSTNRVKIYVNGSQVTAFSTATYPSQNFDSTINTNATVYIGRPEFVSTYYDGYMTEINFIDGQALTPSSFGETDAITGVWKPKKYAGTYGTNGFYLNFSDNSGATATTIGKDYSGNGNNWTPNNISVTSGSTYDSMLDVPTMWADGGNGRGNYAVLNRVNQTTYGSLSDGNLKLSGATDWGGFPSSIPISKTGKWYAEFVLGSTSSNSAQADCGIFPVGNTMYYNWSNSYGLEVNSGFFLITNGSSSSNRGSTTAGGTVFQIAVDADSGKVWFGVNNAWYDTYNTTNGDPSAGTNPSGSGINFDSTTYQMAVKTDFNNWTANFGQRPFAYTPPTGFKALNTQNLPDSTIKKGNQYFDATTYTGNGTSQSIVNSGGFQPDLVWQKERSDTGWHNLVDAVRGAGYRLFSNTTNAESYAATNLTSFNSNGFSVGNDVDWNQSGQTSVAWQWKESASAGFDIVTYTGTGSATTVAHSLGVAPKMMIVKNRTTATGWLVYHASVGNTGALILNGTNATITSADYWNNTSPTSSVFTVGVSNAGNQSGNSLVAYLFAEVAGFSKFGSYTGNGSTSADGPFVYLGFRPRFIMGKRTDSTGGWWVFDTARDEYNLMDDYLYANTSDAEQTNITTLNIDVLSNGFKVRSGTSPSTWINANGGTYIYAAFAEVPFKAALGR